MEDHEIPQDTGERIRYRREELGLSRPQLADRIKADGAAISSCQIYRWEENGAIPRADTAGALERALEVPPGWLAHGELRSKPRKNVDISDYLRHTLGAEGVVVVTVGELGGDFFISMEDPSIQRPLAVALRIIADGLEEAAREREG